LKRTIITYLDDRGDKKEISIEGDFIIGRFNSDGYPKLGLVDSSGATILLSKCSSTVSRIREDGVHARFAWSGDTLYV